MTNISTSEQPLSPVPPNIVMHDIVDSLSASMNILRLNIITQEMPDDLKDDLNNVVTYMKKMSQDLQVLADIISDQEESASAKAA